MVWVDELEAPPRPQAEAELSALNAILWTISESLEEDAVLRSALERTLQALSVEAGEVFLLDESTRRLNWVLHVGAAPEAFTEVRSFALGEGMIGRTAEVAQPQFFDLLTAESLRRPAVRTAGFVRTAGSPLMAKGRVWGVMNLATRQQGRLTTDREPFLAAVGRQVGLALAVARAYSDQRRLNERLEAVNVAATGILTMRTVDETLAEIADQARAITRAKFGAIGVDTPDGALRKFIHSGLSAEAAAQITGPPQGRGILGALRDETTIRLDDLTDDPRFSGFPPHHPEMKSFLGVAINTNGRTVGRIYLGDKEDGTSFTDDDEVSVAVLARHAAVAITNASLYEDLSRQTRYLAAVAEVGKRVTGSLDVDAVLKTIVEGAASAMGADASFVFLRDEETPVLRCVVSTGFKRRDPVGTIIGQRDGVIGRVTDTGMPLFVADIDQDATVLRRIIGPESLRSLLLAPIRSSAASHGVLGVGYERNDSPSVSAQEAIYGLADLTAIALENSHAYAQARRLAVLEDRERIAMDLHDTTLQEIFAARLRIELAADKVTEDPGEAREILLGLVDRLEKVNRSIRSYISTLSVAASVERYRLDLVLQTAVRQIDTGLGSTTVVEVEPHDYPELEPELAEQIILIVREALANAHLHAGASKVTLHVDRNADTILVSVEDDGRGFEPRTAAKPGHFGLHNMYERASRIGGRLQIVSAPGEGARVELSVRA